MSVHVEVVPFLCLCCWVLDWVLCKNGCLQCSVLERGEKKKNLLRFLLIAFLRTLRTITSTSLHPSRCSTSHRLCSQLYISPPQLCHTLDSTVSTLGSTGGSCRAALGSINFIAYFYNPSLCMHPPSHPTTSALTIHTAVKFCVSPCFMAGCSPRLS